MSGKRFAVISIHPYIECNMEPRCSFCYKTNKENYEKKPKEYWYNLIPYLSKLTNQVALGGGEPFMNPAFIKEMAGLCNKNKLILNITSNGKLLMDLSDKELKSTLDGITMVSLSYDKEKIKNKEDLKNYTILANRIKKLTKTQVGCNLLIDQEMFTQRGVPFILLVNFLFKIAKVDRVFALYPKNIKGIDITQFKAVYHYLTKEYKHFYIDDLTKEILEQGYTDWGKSCHYGKELVSINESGIVTGCSFDKADKGILKITEPKDIMNIKNIKIDERFKCPYLKI